MPGRMGYPAFDGIDFSIGAESANAITVSCQLNLGTRACAERVHGTMYLSSDANGDALEAASAGLSLAVGTDGVLIETSTDNCFHFVTESDGDFDVTITETTGANTFYLVCMMPDHTISVSSAITFA